MVEARQPVNDWTTLSTWKTRVFYITVEAASPDPSGAPQDHQCVFTYLFIHSTTIYWGCLYTWQGFEDIVQGKAATRVAGLFFNFFLTFTFCTALLDFSFGLENKRYIKYKDFSRKYEIKRDD